MQTPSGSCLVRRLGKLTCSVLVDELGLHGDGPLDDAAPYVHAVAQVDPVGVIRRWRGVGRVTAPEDGHSRVRAGGGTGNAGVRQTHRTGGGRRVTVRKSKGMEIMKRTEMNQMMTSGESNEHTNIRHCGGR